MVSFAELRDCEPMAFGLAGQRWQQLAGQVADHGNEVDKHLAALADWEGSAAETAQATLGEERKKLRDSADQLGKIGSTLHDFGQFLGDNRKKLQYALDAARDYLLEVHPDGTVTAGGPAALLEGTDSALRAEFLTDVIRDLVRTATEADEWAADALRKPLASPRPRMIGPSRRKPSGSRVALPRLRCGSGGIRCHRPIRSRWCSLVAPRSVDWTASRPLCATASIAACS